MDIEKNKERCKELIKESHSCWIGISNQKAIETVLSELDKKDKIINDAINAVEKLREYFSEDCQADFIGILEILKDKPVIKW